MNILLSLIGLLITFSLLASYLALSALIVSARAERKLENLGPAPLTAGQAAEATEQEWLHEGLLAQSSAQPEARERGSHSLKRSGAHATMESA